MALTCDGDMWILLRNMYREMSIRIKWDDLVSDKISVNQGIQQGAKLSTSLYKCYNNAILDSVTESGLGCHMGTIGIATPTCADDILVLANSECELQGIMDIPLEKNKLGMMMKTMAVTAEVYGRKVNHSTRKTFVTTLFQSERPVTEVAQLGGWKSISTLTHYNIPSIKQQSKASKILSEITIPESSNELDAVNLINEPEHRFDTVIVNEPEHSFDTEPNDNNTDNLNNELETVLEKENIPNPIFSQSSSMNSKMISTATRKESNPFSILCRATITGGVINLNIYSGKRKHYELDSSQE
ncbi:unnamed protein product [Mytilus coruscus]|uniref:Tyr recombinase domain-containing protein n=1 Tax=Mytilus coruscus TaxID=42192 RepID=A0A6J8DPP4_MYTCO|nr:unnamed protein product [Mytilus coruscus]